MNNRPTFSQNPATSIDDSDIELLELDEKSDSRILMNDDDQSAHCYTTEYACAPFKAACHEVRNSSMHLRNGADDNNAPSRFETLVQLGCATPIMFTGATIVSVFGFFAGAARDGYHAVANKCYQSSEEQEPDSRPSI